MDNKGLIYNEAIDMKMKYRPVCEAGRLVLESDYKIDLRANNLFVPYCRDLRKFIGTNSCCANRSCPFAADCSILKMIENHGEQCRYRKINKDGGFCCSLDAIPCVKCAMKYQDRHRGWVSV